nr:ankyrin repeat domain-containing protein [Alphaproteobacteria bacterium]
ANDLEKALRIAKNKGYKEIADYLNSNLPSDQKPGNEQVLQLLLAGKNAIPLNNRQIEQSMNDPYKNGKPVSYELLQLVREGNKEKINEFIKKWSTIGTNNIYAAEVFTLALDTKDIELIKYLLENKINPNIPDYKRRIALLFFAWNGDLNMVKYLIDKGANDIERALKIAKKKRYTEMSNYLQPLVENLLEQENAIEALYKDLAIDKRKMEVTSEGLLAFANALMIKFPKVNTGIKRVIETLWFATEKGRLDILKYLIRNKIDLEVRNKKKNTPLLSTSKQISNWETFKYLIDHGANVNAQDKKELTALYYAASGGHENIVKYLVEHGADPNKGNEFKDTPLLRATKRRHDDIVKYLVEHGADINAQDIEGGTALYYAASRSYENIVKYLVKHGADINKESEGGWTALHIAADNNHENIVKYLVEHGADINKENGLGQTALDCAERTEIRTYLVEHGATTGSQIKAGLYLYTFNE